jgi:hypothetical protein
MCLLRKRPQLSEKNKITIIHERELEMSSACLCRKRRCPGNTLQFRAARARRPDLFFVPKLPNNPYQRASALADPNTFFVEQALRSGFNPNAAALAVINPCVKLCGYCDGPKKQRLGVSHCKHEQKTLYRDDDGIEYVVVRNADGRPILQEVD